MIALQTVSQASSNAHFEVLVVLITIGLTAVGYFVRRALNASDRRYEGLVTGMSETNKKLGDVAEGLANVVGQMSVYNEIMERSNGKST